MKGPRRPLLLLFFLALAVRSACPATVPDESRSLRSPGRRWDGALRSTGRSYFDAEDVLLFMLGLGLASLLGLATFMAPFTSILASGLTPVTVNGNGVVPGATAAITHGRRRRHLDALNENRKAALLMEVLEQTHRRFLGSKSPTA